jgi:hypothetical protein
VREWLDELWRRLTVHPFKGAIDDPLQVFTRLRDRQRLELNTYHLSVDVTVSHPVTGKRQVGQIQQMLFSLEG